MTDPLQINYPIHPRNPEISPARGSLDELLVRIGRLEKQVADLQDRFPQRMSIDDLARYLHKSKATIYNYNHRQLIPIHYDGGPFYLKDEIDEWIKNGGVRGAKKSLTEKVDRNIARLDKQFAD